MSWNERIKAAREAQKLTREQTVRKMRAYLPEGKTAAARTLVAWEQGDSEPKVTQAIALARALGYHEVSELFSQADGPQLNRLGMDRLEEYRRLLLQSDEFREQPAVHRLRSLPVYLQPASAGTGQWLDDALAEEIEVDDAVPARAEFGVRLAGDSMSPRFADGHGDLAGAAMLPRPSHRAAALPRLYAVQRLYARDLAGLHRSDRGVRPG